MNKCLEVNLGCYLNNECDKINLIKSQYLIDQRNVFLNETEKE